MAPNVFCDSLYVGCADLKDRKYKVLVFADGTSIHTEKWLYGLSLRDDFELYFVTLNPSEVRQGIRENRKIRKIINLGKKQVSEMGGNYHYLFRILDTRKAIQEIQPDAISTIYLTSYGLIGSLLKGSALLMHFVIGSDLMIYPEKSWLYRQAAKFSLKRSDLIISVSKAIAERIQVLVKRPDEDMLVQQYGIDDSLLTYHAGEVEYDFVSNRGWVPNSNIPLILQAISGMDESPSLALVGGDGDQQESVHSLVEQMPNVTCFGMLEHLKNIDVVAKSKFFLSLTSSDGTALSLLEAMALGSIPVVSDIEPNREWIEHGVNGFLIDISNVDSICNGLKEVVNVSDLTLNNMRQKNRDIIRDRGCISRNMGNISDLLVKKLLRG